MASRTEGAANVNVELKGQPDTGALRSGAVAT